MKNNEKRKVIIPIDNRKEIKVVFPDYIEERKNDNLKKPPIQEKKHIENEQ